MAWLLMFLHWVTSKTALMAGNLLLVVLSSEYKATSNDKSLKRPLTVYMEKGLKGRAIPEKKLEGDMF